MKPCPFWVENAIGLPPIANDMTARRMENIATTAIYTHLTEPTRASLRHLLDTLMGGL